MRQELKQREARNKEKAAALVQWFKGLTLPTPPFRLNHYTIMNDPQQYVTTQIAIIEHSPPLGRPFYLACMRLWELKQYIQHENERSSQPDN